MMSIAEYYLKVHLCSLPLSETAKAMEFEFPFKSILSGPDGFVYLKYYVMNNRSNRVQMAML